MNYLLRSTKYSFSRVIVPVVEQIKISIEFNINHRKEEVFWFKLIKTIVEHL